MDIYSRRIIGMCCVIFLTAVMPSTSAAADVSPVTVTSPNGKIKVEIRAETNGPLTWSVRRQEQLILAAAPLGLTVDGHDLGRSVTLGAARNRSIDEQYPMWGNHSVAVNRCNEAVIPVETVGAMNYELEVRAYDDGAAVRTRVALDDTLHSIAGEATSWSLPPHSLAWWAEYDNSYEKPYRSGTYESIPANVPLAPPVTFQVGDNLYIALTEANNDCFPDMGLVRQGAFLKAVFPPSSNGWKHKGPIVTPWRVAIIAEGLNALVNSDMVTNLCPPPSEELANADWIKPGRSLWQWWSIGAPRLDDQKDWVDAAKRLGFEYYLIDDGWRRWNLPGKDQWQCLKDVIDYGKSQGVASLVWVNSAEMRDAASRRAYLERVAALGAAGIKIDFIPSCTAEITRWYEGALKDTAELRLLCNFHGAVKLTGRQRTWPHELTREGVRGHEYHMTRYGRVQAADHDQIVLFTRFLAGPADYTPTAFDPREMVGYTWAHLLAQAVNMTSPLLHFAGKYQDFVGNPAEDLLRHLPSTWDETLVLSGSEIGKTVGFARRRGQEWFIGLLNGASAATMPIDLSFLGPDSWQAEIFGDDPANAAAFKRDNRTVTAADQLTIDMSPRGGAVIRFTKPSQTPDAAAATDADARSIAPYFTPAVPGPKAPDPDGFLQRWLLLEPISLPLRSNAGFTETFVRSTITTEYFPNQFTVVPNDGDTVTVDEKELAWHALDTSTFNAKVFRFAYGLDKPTYGVLFWAVTVVNCPQDIQDVRMAVGSNSASMWWVNGQEAVHLFGDRRMVMDDCVSKRLTLKQGPNIIRGAVINGPGLSDFCVRFIDEEGQPVKDLTIHLEAAN